MRRLDATLITLTILGASACAAGEEPTSETFQQTVGLPGDGDQGDGDTGEGEGDGDGDTGEGDGDGEGGDGDSTCGNGAIEGQEECDGGDLGGATCSSEGFGGGGLQCTDACTLDTSNCNACGNGTLEPGEECDGAELGAASSCADINLGTPEEALSCTAGCKYDFSECSGCGDGVVTAPELCEPASELLDKADLDGQTCTSLGFDNGLLDCTEGCTFNTDSCYVCGDAVQQGQEECDGADFDSATCSDYTSISGEPFAMGSLSCTDQCLINPGNCSLCGDGVVSGAEVCDGGALDGKTCLTQGFDGGSLSCNANCTGFNTSACTDCGDGVIEGAEQCDFNNLGGETCQSQGFPGGGTLGCTLGCVLDTSMCANNFCGDGLVNGMDQCDCGNQGQNCTAAQLGNQTCMSRGYDGGALACNSPNNCTFNEAGCYACGDGNINPGEQCDGNNLGGQTCQSLGFAGGGNLSCTANCQHNTLGCVAVPNPYTICTSPNLPIPDLVETPSSINVGVNGTITDINVYVNMLHTWVGDVDMRIGHSGVTRYIMDRPGVPASTFGCSYDNINATFDDQGNGNSELTCNQTPPASAAILSPPNFFPTQTLSSFNGQNMNGTWTLTSMDHFSGDSGTLLQWCMTITWQ